MNHPLVPQLQTLMQLLNSHPQAATMNAVVKALDKVAASTHTAIQQIQDATAGSSPEAQSLQRLLEQAFGNDADEKEAKKVLKPVLAKLPPRKTLSLSEYFALVATTAAKNGEASEAAALVRQHLNRPKFNPNANDEYELLKQIRQLGQMDEQQRKAAKAYLAGEPDLVIRLCKAAYIPTTSGKVPKPVKTAALITKLLALGVRYAENTGG